MKKTLTPFIGLAQMLFEMELESIGNDKKFHWEFNGWLDKFGENSIKFEPKFVSKQKDIEELAKLIKADFDSGVETPGENGELYNYMMPTNYGGFIVDKLEEQLADLTGVGTQLEIFN